MMTAVVADDDVVKGDYGAPAAPLFTPDENVNLPSSEQISPPSYAAAANPAPNTAQAPIPEISVNHADNELPSRPCTAFLNPRVRLTHSEFFESLRDAAVDPQAISCIQRQSNGEIVLTFRNVEQREAFLQKNVLQINGQPFAIQDVDRPLTYVQIFDAPYELPDSTIINRLQKFCDVIHHRRGYFREEQFRHIQDGTRHYRVRINQPIPNFIRFGKIVINVRYPGQPRTCRHCNLRGHLANACTNLICFNCEQVGHQAATCPEAIKCNLCKSTDHKAKHCPFSWSRSTPATTPAHAEDTSTPPAETSTEPTQDPPTLSNEDQPMAQEISPAATQETAPLESPEMPSDPPPSDTLPSFALSSETAMSTPLEDAQDIHTPEFPEDDETLYTDESSSEELFSESPHIPNSGRLPGKISEICIPSRKPTQPTLVSGTKNAKTHPLDNSDEPRSKRSRKHRKSKDRK